MSFKFVIVNSVLVMALAPFLAFAEERQDDRRVKAKEPTVVTVRGKQDQVDVEQTRPRRGPLARVGHGLKTGAMKAAGGVVAFTGWLMDVDDDVPSERERSRRSADR